jgi:hypothetical protein
MEISSVKTKTIAFQMKARIFAIKFIFKTKLLNKLNILNILVISETDWKRY